MTAMANSSTPAAAAAALDARKMAPIVTFIHSQVTRMRNSVANVSPESFGKPVNAIFEGNMLSDKNTNTKIC
jgi:hypothetical protein